MNSPVLQVPPLPVNPKLFDDFGKALSESWKWLGEQYERKRLYLEAYEQRESTNQQYILKEKTFLLALLKHLRTLDKIEKHVRFLERENMNLSRGIVFRDKLFTLYGHSNFELQWDLGTDEKYIDEQIEKNIKENTVKIPHAIGKIFMDEKKLAQMLAELIEHNKYKASLRKNI